MSMMCRMLQIDADLLAQLQEDSSSVADLFDGESPATPQFKLPTGPAVDEIKRRMLPQLQRVMRASFASLDEHQREALQKRLESLGLAPEMAQDEAGAEKLLNSMFDRRGQLAQMLANATAGGGLRGGGAKPVGGVRGSLSLDKAWHGLHFLLCGKVEPDADPASQAVLGGEKIGEDDFGYGPARYLTPAQVADISALLERNTLAEEVKVRFNPAEMIRLGIYPNGWTAKEFDWLNEELQHLREFYREASANGRAILSCLT